MNCPRCASPMNQTRKGPILLDICARCGGIWFDDNELVSTLNSDPGAVNLDTHNRAIRQRHNPTIVCPKCKRPAREINYCLNSNIFIDVCDTCRSLFLDGGELKQIYHYFIVNDMFDDTAPPDRSSLFAAIASFFSSFGKSGVEAARQSALSCPRCGTGLEEVDLLGEKTDLCTGCGGMWFDKGELSTCIDRGLPAQARHDSAGVPAVNGSSSEQEDAYILCPRCNNYLAKHAYMSLSDIMIDSCKHCSGVWLDKSEFQKIVTYYRSSRDPEKLAEECGPLFTRLHTEHERWKEHNRKLFWKGFKEMAALHVNQTLGVVSKEHREKAKSSIEADNPGTSDFLTG